jgi:hypothetical protein
MNRTKNDEPVAKPAATVSAMTEHMSCGRAMQGMSIEKFDARLSG